MQVPSPANGVIEALLVPDGGKVEGGTPLFTLRKTGGKEVLLVVKVSSVPPWNWG